MGHYGRPGPYLFLSSAARENILSLVDGGEVLNQCLDFAPISRGGSAMYDIGRG